MNTTSNRYPVSIEAETYAHLERLRATGADEATTQPRHPQQGAAS